MSDLPPHKSCVITGVSSGIGAAAAECLRRNGYRVVGIQRRPPGVSADLMRIDNLPDAWQSALKELGATPGLVVLNAGRSLDGPFVETTSDEAVALITLNLIAPLILAREAIKTWVARDAPGHLVLVGSQAALAGAKQSGNVLYTASKGGLHAVVGPLAAEYGPRIRVNAIAPGDVETEVELSHLRRQAERSGLEFTQLKEEVARRAASRRWVSPQEVAEAILFMDRCEAMNGAVLNISAGSSVH